MKFILTLLLAMTLSACGSDSATEDGGEGSNLKSQTIAFDQAGALALNVGDEVSNPVTALGTGTVTYSSSNAGVVSVDNQGDLQAIAAGTATITAAITADDEFLAGSISIEVSVSKLDRSLTLDEGNSEILNIGDENILFRVLGYSNVDVNFSSSDESIIQVANSELGYVRALASGTVTITLSVPATDIYNAASISFDVSVRQVQLLGFNQSGPLNINVGSQASVAATTDGTGTITYSSSNESVITVNEAGNVMAVAAGSAVISANIEGNDQVQAVSASIEINVVKQDWSLSLDERTPTRLDIGTENVLLTVLGYVEVAATFSSSDESIITVTNAQTGYVSALASGTATITVNIAATLTHNASSFSFDIYVRQAQNISLSTDGAVLNLTQGEQTSIRARGESTGDISYSTDNESVVSVDANGAVVALAKGSTLITVSIAGDDDFSAASVDISVNVSGPALRLVAEVGRTDTVTTFTNASVTFDVATSSNDSCNLFSCPDGTLQTISEFPASITETNTTLNTQGYYHFETEDNLYAATKIAFDTRPHMTQSTVSYFNGYLWMLGGRPRGVSDGNEIWRSADGLSWERIYSSQPFAARNSHSAVAYNGKLYVIGGYVSNYYNRDVYSSDDGENWVRETEQLPSEGAVSVTSTKSFVYKNNLYTLVGANVTSNNRLYILNEDGSWVAVEGFSGNFYLTSDTQVAINGDRIIVASYNGALYYSDDGFSWTTQTTIPSKVLDPNNLGRLSLYSFQNKFWAVGAYQKVYSSDDGLDWTLENDQAQYTTRANADFTMVFKDQLWLMGGSKASDRFVSEDKIVDVSLDNWVSRDGKNWQQITKEGEFGAIKDHELVKFDGALWIIGGNSSNYSFVNETWKSTNGIDWVLDRGEKLAPTQLKRSHVVEFDNKLWMLTGTNLDVSEFYTAQQVDGSLQWDKVEVELPFTSRVNHQLLAYDNQLWVLGGTSYYGNTVYTDVWSSTNGIDWEQKTSNWDLVAYEMDIKFHRAAVFDGKMWVTGGTSNTNLSSTMVAYSDDGITWTKANGSGVARNGHDVAVIDDKLLIYPGGQSNQLGHVYYIQEGSTDIRASFTAHNNSRSFGVTEFNNRVWTIGGYDTRYNVTTGDIWVSDDGINNWRRVSKRTLELEASNF